MKENTRMKPTIKLWVQIDDEPVGGEGRIELLQTIDEEGSLNSAAKKLGMSYRHVWGTIKKLEKRLGFKLVKSEKGGSGGGGSKLTDKGLKLVDQYNRMYDVLNKMIKTETFWENMSTEISARNHLKGEVLNVDLGEVGAKIKIKVEPSKMTAFITKEAAEDLELEKGDEVEAIVKATEVMVSKS